MRRMFLITPVMPFDGTTNMYSVAEREFGIDEFIYLQENLRKDYLLIGKENVPISEEDVIYQILLFLDLNVKKGDYVAIKKKKGANPLVRKVKQLGAIPVYPIYSEVEKNGRKYLHVDFEEYK